MAIDLETLRKDGRIILEDPNTEEKETSTLEYNKQITEYNRLNEEVESIKQDRKERKIYASKTFDFLCVYMMCVGLLLLMSGSTTASFQLSDSVLIVILGTTTTNVLGIFYFVANYLFPKRHRTTEQERTTDHDPSKCVKNRQNSPNNY
nr:MAG TPA: SMODS and SLOG-associating 2TM effector domain [Caudoviricetes sp.]